jgi:addiction module RelE/StbE family toxin
LEDIYERIAADNPDAAPRVIEQIRIAVERLQEFPMIGRPGRVEGTRELVVAGTPYIVPYRVKAEIVQIITVLHSAQRWPDRFP